MSITGTYRMVNGALIRISVRVPRIGAVTSDLCSFAKPYWDTNIGDDPVYLSSRKQKAELLRKQGLIEKSRVHGGIDECKRNQKKTYFDLSKE